VREAGLTHEQFVHDVRAAAVAWATARGTVTEAEAERILAASWSTAPATGGIGACVTTAHGQTVWAPSRAWRSPLLRRNRLSRWRGPRCTSPGTSWPAGERATARSGSGPARGPAFAGFWPRDSAIRTWLRLIEATEEAIGTRGSPDSSGSGSGEKACLIGHAVVEMLRRRRVIRRSAMPHPRTASRHADARLSCEQVFCYEPKIFELLEYDEDSSIHF